MNMKRTAVTLALVAGLAFTGFQQASARGWGGGYGGGYGADCPYSCYGPNSPQMDPATQEKIDAFRNDTLELRKQIAMKRAEMRALMGSQNPDPSAVARVEGEIFDLRTAMQQKADEAGVPMMGGPRGTGGPGGKGGPYGRMMPCGNQQRFN